MNLKQLAAEKAVSFLEDGMTVGLGTGTTAYWAIEKIGELVNQQGWKIRAIATSLRSEQQARSLHIPIVDFSEIGQIDVTIDGADEVDSTLHLIKGGGGALLREKIVASNSKKLIIVADQSKQVSILGKFPLPVEVVLFGWEKTVEKLAALGCLPSMRMDKENNKPYITDNGNYIIDCAFGAITDPPVLHDKLNAIVGVVDNGLFIHLATKLIVGFENDTTQIFSAPN